MTYERRKSKREAEKTSQIHKEAKERALLAELKKKYEQET